MDAYTIMIIALGAGIIFMGTMLVKRLRVLKSMPDEEKMRERSDVQQMLRKHLEEQQSSSEGQDADGGKHAS